MRRRSNLFARVDGGLFYANTTTIREDLLERIEKHETPVELVVFDLVSSPIVDLAAAEMLEDVYDDLESDGTDRWVAGANAQVCRLLEAAGLDEKLGGIREDETVASVSRRWRSDRDASLTVSASSRESSAVPSQRVYRDGVGPTRGTFTHRASTLCRWFRTSRACWPSWSRRTSTCSLGSSRGCASRSGSPARRFRSSLD
ncbi:sodium-independent anion transporter [Halorussus halophilus]|uniref:sodium-independent anion transporter n=1 Tax=Halorussus halophilus TaxID=2650975 RepID=UPI001CE4131F|nr:sodium-independent anion transporter [Halorussus halophilus]